MKTSNFAIALLGLSVIYAADPPTWNHSTVSPSGPLNWGSVAPQYATCGTTGGGTFTEVGTKQTPINIETAKVVEAVLPQLGFRYLPTPFEVENTGHVVEVVYEAGSYLRVGSSLTDQYQLAQFHFHAPSEHTVDGKRYDAELHLVHTNRLGENAVVGIFLTKSATAPVGVFDDILTNAPFTSTTSAVAGVTVNARNLLPRHHSFYAYTGSLTTPPCTEGIHWFVMTEPVMVRDFVVDQLHRINGLLPGYNGFLNNNRPVVPTNSRTVLLNR